MFDKADRDDEYMVEFIAQFLYGRDIEVLWLVFAARANLFAFAKRSIDSMRPVGNNGPMNAPSVPTVTASGSFPFGIVEYGTYVPRYRLNLSAIGGALGASGGGGSRAVASYDEDTTTMAVEAARLLPNAGLSNLYFATTRPAYWHKTNATAIHAALALDAACFAADLGVSPRSAVAAFKAAGATGGVAASADILTGLPGSAEERQSSDGAAAFLFGPVESSRAIVITQASASAEFIDRWALPGDERVRYWEERFGTEMYLPLIKAAGRAALDRAQVETPDHVISSSPHARLGATASKLYGSTTPSGPAGLGYVGAADFGLRLAAVLDRAGPGETILVLSISDGCDALVLRTTDHVGAAARGTIPLEQQLAAGIDVSYFSYLSWRGILHRDPPRRPEPDRPAAPPSARSTEWKFGFSGSRCQACGFLHLPPTRQCKHCGALDQMDTVRLADHHGTVATFTVDRLAFSPAPPLIDVVVDFDGGGRTIVEMTDVQPDEVGIGTRVEMTFRSLYTVDGIHNYFWKARPESSEKG